MCGLKNKNEISSYDQKAKILRENGWDTWYNDDNWIKIEWIKHGKRYDHMGRTTNDAFRSLKQSALEWWYNLPIESHDKKDKITYAKKHGYSDVDVSKVSESVIFMIFFQERPLTTN